MKVIDNIYYIKIRYYNLYVISGINGDILIDTGFFGMHHNLDKIMARFNIKLIILTHAHIDHAWNVAYLKNKYNCKVAMGKKDIANINNSNINSSPSKKRYKLWTRIMNYGMKKFIPKSYYPDIVFDRDIDVEYYGIKLKIIMLSGHTDGSIGIQYKDYLFAGDALVNRGRFVGIAYQNQNNKNALKAVHKIKGINPNTIFIGHDRPINSKKFQKSLDKILK